MADAACARIQSAQLSVTINWPVHIGSMASVCMPRHDHGAAETLVCHRGSVTDLCEVVMDSPNSNFQVIPTSCCLIIPVCCHYNGCTRESDFVGHLYCTLQRPHL